MGEERKKELLGLTGTSTWALEILILRLSQPGSLNLQEMISQAPCLLDYLLALSTPFTLPFSWLQDGAAGLWPFPWGFHFSTISWFCEQVQIFGAL